MAVYENSGNSQTNVLSRELKKPVNFDRQLWKLWKLLYWKLWQLWQLSCICCQLWHMKTLRLKTLTTFTLKNPENFQTYSVRLSFSLTLWLLSFPHFHTLPLLYSFFVVFVLLARLYLCRFGRFAWRLLCSWPLSIVIFYNKKSKPPPVYRVLICFCAFLAKSL